MLRASSIDGWLTLAGVDHQARLPSGIHAQGVPARERRRLRPAFGNRRRLRTRTPAMPSAAGPEPREDARGHRAEADPLRRLARPVDVLSEPRPRSRLTPSSVAPPCSRLGDGSLRPLRPAEAASRRWLKTRARAGRKVGFRAYVRSAVARPRVGLEYARRYRCRQWTR